MLLITLIIIGNLISVVGDLSSMETRDMRGLSTVPQAWVRIKDASMYRDVWMSVCSVWLLW